jgi:hypothetical protein
MKTPLDAPVTRITGVPIFAYHRERVDPFKFTQVMYTLSHNIYKIITYLKRSRTNPSYNQLQSKISDIISGDMYDKLSHTNVIAKAYY